MIASPPPDPESAVLEIPAGLLDRNSRVKGRSVYACLVTLDLRLRGVNERPLRKETFSLASHPTDPRRVRSEETWLRHRAGAHALFIL